MSARLEAYALELSWVFDQLAASLAHYVSGATRAYALGLGCGHCVSRIRAAEFGDQPVAGAAGTLGEGELHEMSRRQAIVDSIRHEALHLGELRLTCDLIAG